METQDVGSFSACMCQPDRHATDDEKALAQFIRNVDLPEEAPDDTILIARAILAAGYSRNSDARRKALEAAACRAESFCLTEWDHGEVKDRQAIGRMIAAAIRALAEQEAAPPAAQPDLADKLAEALQVIHQCHIDGGFVQPDPEVMAIVREALALYDASKGGDQQTVGGTKCESW